MKVISLEDFKNNLDFYVQEALNRKIFIYPTDTLYWIWGITTLEITNSINNIKDRDERKNYSIISPNFSWIKENFIVPEDFDNHIMKSLKEYHWITFLLERKNKSFLDFLSNNEKIWVRILKHDFQNFVTKLDQPFITTSANISWDISPSTIEDINKQMIERVDYVIDGWKLLGKPSVIINWDEIIFRDK